MQGGIPGNAGGSGQGGGAAWHPASGDVGGAHQQRTSRMAELAAELVGAKAAAEFLKEAWDAASPEAKQGIADALIKKVTDMITAGGGGISYDPFNLDRMLKETVTPYVQEMLKGHEDQFNGAIKAKLEEYTKEQIVEVGVKIGKQIVDLTARSMLDKLGEMVRSFRGY